MDSLHNIGISILQAFKPRSRSRGRERSRSVDHKKSLGIFKDTDLPHQLSHQSRFSRSTKWGSDEDIRYHSEVNEKPGTVPTTDVMSKFEGITPSEENCSSRPRNVLRSESFGYGDRKGKTNRRFNLLQRSLSLQQRKDNQHGKPNQKGEDDQQIKDEKQGKDNQQDTSSKDEALPSLDSSDSLHNEENSSSSNVERLESLYDNIQRSQSVYDNVNKESIPYSENSNEFIDSTEQSKGSNICYSSSNKQEQNEFISPEKQASDNTGICNKDEENAHLSTLSKTDGNNSANKIDNNGNSSKEKSDVCTSYSGEMISLGKTDSSWNVDESTKTPKSGVSDIAMAVKQSDTLGYSENLVNICNQSSQQFEEKESGQKGLDDNIEGQENTTDNVSGVPEPFSEPTSPRDKQKLKKKRTSIFDFFFHRHKHNKQTETDDSKEEKDDQKEMKDDGTQSNDVSMSDAIKLSQRQDDEESNTEAKMVNVEGWMTNVDLIHRSSDDALEIQDSVEKNSQVNPDSSDPSPIDDNVTQSSSSIHLSPKTNVCNITCFHAFIVFAVSCKLVTILIRLLFYLS